MGIEETARAVLRLQAGFLEEIEGPFRRIARPVVETSVHRARTRIGRLEEGFRRIMERYPNELTDSDARRAAISLFDEAYDLGERRWGDAAKALWKGMYRDAEGRRVLERWRRRGAVAFDLEKLAKGQTPSMITMATDGRREFRPINIDHAVPRGRNPFRAFDASNLRLIGERHNQWLNQFSRGIFPMHPGREDDPIERYALANQLDRYNRPEGERPRPRRSQRRRRHRRPRAARTASGVGIVALLADLLGASSRAEAYAELARQARAHRTRREREQSRRDIGRDEVEPYNLDNQLELVYNHHEPPMVDSETQAALVAAFRQWIETNYGPGGSGTRRFESAFEEARAESSTPTGGRPSERNDALGVLMVRHIDEYRYLEDALEIVQGLLRPADLYERRADALERLADLTRSELEGELRSYGVSLEDATTLWTARLSVAAAYRNYVDKLEELEALVRTAMELTEDRQSRIERAIEDPLEQ